MIAEGALVDDRYRLDQPAGRGRAGIVWLAFDTRLQRTVTAKRMYIQPGLEPALAEDARAIALREGRAACRLVHNCAVAVHDVVTEGADVWLIMEYVPSRSMDDFLAEHGRLTPFQAAALGAQLGAALEAAHTLGITHGALEPGNVLLADDGGVKITDFGISGPGPSPAFRAPELAAGAPASPASDAFSLGATLYAAVEGTPPFGMDGQAGQVAPQHASVLTGALLKLVRIDPAMRPTLHDTVTALRAIGTGDESAVVPPTAPPGTHTAQPRTAPQPQPAAAEPPEPPAPAQPSATTAVREPVQPAQPPAQPVQDPTRQPVQPGPPMPPEGTTAPPAAPVRPRAAGHGARGWIITVLAILAAIAVGILFTELVIL